MLHQWVRRAAPQESALSIDNVDWLLQSFSCRHCTVQQPMCYGSTVSKGAHSCRLKAAGCVCLYW